MSGKRLWLGLVAGLWLAVGCAGVSGLVRPAGDEAPEWMTTCPPPCKGISLRIVQEKLAACSRSGSCPRSVLELGDIKGIVSVAVDRAGQDIYLVGRMAGDGPALQLQDFIVALRNAWQSFTHPACSIDPSPTVMRRLVDLYNGRPSRLDLSAMHRLADQWKHICRAPQAVRVMGVSHRTHFASVMVQADYHMKQLASGADRPYVPGFSSLKAMTLHQAQEQLASTGRVSLQGVAMNRFWFFPGAVTYKDDVDVITLETCPVKLLTEEQYLSERGRLQGRKRPHPLAQQFVENFTAHYQAVALQRPIYAELANLFRFVAVARVVKRMAWPSRVGLDLSFFLRGYRLPEVDVPRRLPGRSGAGVLKISVDSSGMRRMGYMLYATCGGVSIAINAGPGNIIRDRSGRLAELRNRVLTSRRAAVARAARRGEPPPMTWMIPATVVGSRR